MNLRNSIIKKDRLLLQAILFYTRLTLFIYHGLYTFVLYIINQQFIQ